MARPFSGVVTTCVPNFVGILLAVLELKHTDGQPDHPSMCHCLALSVNNAWQRKDRHYEDPSDNLRNVLVIQGFSLQLCLRQDVDLWPCHTHVGMTTHLISAVRIFRNAQCLNCSSYFPSRRHLLAIHQRCHNLHLSFERPDRTENTTNDTLVTGASVCVPVLRYFVYTQTGYPFFARCVFSPLLRVFDKKINVMKLVATGAVITMKEN
jgi:hypothetical protein